MADDNPRTRANSVRLFLHTELQTALNFKSGARKIASMRYMLLVLTEHCKDVLDPETYKILHDEYIKTDTTVRKEKEARERERREKLEAKEELENRKKQAYVKQTDIAKEKRKDKVEKELGSLQNLKRRRDTLIESQARYPRGSDYWNNMQKQIEELDKQIKRLES